MTLIRQACQLTGGVTLALLAATFAGNAQAQSRFAVSADGQEVQDSQTQLTWRRCSEGTRWDGKTCAGKPAKFNYAGARKTASALASSSKQAWRIPAKAELLSLVDKTHKKPLIDSTTFPTTPAGMFWATRPEASDTLNAWIVNFANGRVYGNPGSKAPYLRLVRSSG